MSDRWEKIVSLLAKANLLSSSNRIDFIDNADSVTESTKREAKSLLGWQGRADDVLATIENARHLSSEKINGRYSLLQEINRGGMGVVYRAHDHDVKRLVAVKFISNSAKSSSSIERFRREARVVAKLDHPNIVTVYDFGRDDRSGLYFLVMPLIEGGSLRDLLRHGPMENEDIQEIVGQIGSALEYAHSQGIIHRDIKPENILISEKAKRRHFRLGDFGLARELNSTRLTQSGAIVGSIPYLSPEQVAGNPTTILSDIYSFGTILYECACGATPFTGNPHHLLYQIAHRPSPSIPKSLGLDDKLELGILTCLQKDPARRPQSVGDLLDTISSSVGAGSLQPSESEHGSRGRRSEISRRNVLVGTAAAALTIATTLDLLSFSKNNSITTLNDRPQEDGPNFPGRDGSDNLRWIARSESIHRKWMHSATLLQNGRILVAGGVDISNDTTNTAEIYNPLSNSWAEAPQMVYARVRHAATLLPNGRVLLTGGVGNGGHLRTAEVFDPLAGPSGAWTRVSNMNGSRSRHTATLLLDGRVLVVGGEEGVSSAEIYDYREDQWYPVESLREGRGLHTATLLRDGRVLVAGGGRSGMRLDLTEIFDPREEAWTLAGRLNQARFLFTATLLHDGRVLAVGGSPGSDSLRSVEFFDVQSQRWVLGPELNLGRYRHTANLLPDGRLLVVSGRNSKTNNRLLDSVEIFDPRSSSSGGWKLIENVLEGRERHTSTMLRTGKVFVVGGGTDKEDVTPLNSTSSIGSFHGGTWARASRRNNEGQGARIALLPSGRVLVVGGANPMTETRIKQHFASTELFDPSVDRWIPMQDMAEQRSSHSISLLPDGRVLVAGGHSFSSPDRAGGFLATAEIFKEDEEGGGEWSSAADMVGPRGGHAATCLYDGTVLVTGGRRGGRALLALAELYDPAVDRWRALSRMNVPRRGHGAVLLPDGRVLVVGGRDGSNFQTARTEIFDPDFGDYGRWQIAPDLAEPRTSHGMQLLNDGRVLVMGGFSGAALSSTEIFDPSKGVRGEWSRAASMSRPRMQFSTVVLSDGRVMAIGGVDGSVSESTEIYDPELDQWTESSPMAFRRRVHKSLLLPSGKIFVLGGHETDARTIAELFDPYSIAGEKPILLDSQNPFVLGTGFRISGRNLRGWTGSSGGNDVQNSSTNYPLAQIRSVSTGQTEVLLPETWSSTSFLSKPIHRFPVGYATINVWVNGVPGNSITVRVVA